MMKFLSLGASLLLCGAAQAGPLIRLVNTDRAMHAPGVAATVWMDLENRTGAAFSGTVTLSVSHLGRPALGDRVFTVPLLAPGASTTLTASVTPPPANYRGYYLRAVARDASGAVVDTGASAMDVSTDWAKFPRYGFLTAFGPGVDTGRMAWLMKNYHLNAIQFYDWQWRHHRPFSPNAQWPNLANQTISRATVQGHLSALHGYGIAAMNYNLLYGAYDNYWQDGSGVQTSWGLFKSPTAADPAHQIFHPLPGDWATSKLFVMNPANPDWRDYLYAREKEVFDHFAFDGWHIDSLGWLGEAYDAGHNPVDVAAAFPAFVNGAKAALDRRMLFNIVGAYGREQVVREAGVDALYSEKWDDEGRYRDLAAFVEWCQARSDKAVILAAYMNKGAPGPHFREPSVRLANAVLFASGASHIELGDGEAMLSNEYFPWQPLTMGNSLRDAIADQYHFLTAYENLLRDGARRGNLRLELSGAPASADGRAGTVWVMPKQRPGADIIHLINLTANTTDQWRDTAGTCPYPPVLANLTARLYTEGSIAPDGRLWLASPDTDHGNATPLPFTRGEDTCGQYVQFTIPRLEYWDMLWLEKGPLVGGTLLAESFESIGVGALPSGWTPVSGTWAVRQPAGQTREVQVEPGGGILRYTPGFNEGDYTVEARVHVTSTTGNAAILGRVQHGGGFYQLEIQDGRVWKLYKHDGGSTWRELASGPFAYSAGTDHLLRLTLQRNHLSAEIDGQPVGAYTDYEDPYTTGSIGLRSESQAVRFDDVRVVSPRPDAFSALKAAGGLAGTPGDIPRLDAEVSGDSAGRVDILDAVRILRAASGLS